MGSDNGMGSTHQGAGDHSQLLFEASFATVSEAVPGGRWAEGDCLDKLSDWNHSLKYDPKQAKEATCRSKNIYWKAMHNTQHMLTLKVGTAISLCRRFFPDLFVLPYACRRIPATGEGVAGDVGVGASTWKYLSIRKGEKVLLLGEAFLKSWEIRCKEERNGERDCQ